MVSHDELSGEPFLKTDADELGRTVVSPAMDEPHEAGKNILYCGSIQLAWNELIERSSGPVRFAEPCPVADRLNQASAIFTKDDLDEESYVAHAGEGDAVLHQIKKELARKFGGAASPKMLPDHIQADMLFVYAYLFKNLAFATPLLQKDGWGLSFDGQEVRHFGLWKAFGESRRKEQAKQVVIHDYQSDTDFVVELLTKAKDDRLIIARIAPQEELFATIEQALGRTGPSMWSRVTGGAGLREQDTLKIPIIDFDIDRTYRELAGKQLADGRPIEKANQSIRFRLDDKGALLKSEFRMSIPRGRGLPRPGFMPRNFICDGPFLVLLLRKGRKAPYLALWIDNTELLIPARTSSPPDNPGIIMPPG